MRKSRRGKRIQGIVKITSRGVGFLQVPGEPIAVEIAKENLKTALPGDTIEVELLPGKKDERRGIVTTILERKRTRFVGTVRREGETLVVAPDERRIYTSFLLSPDDARKAVLGNKVLIRMTSWKAGDMPNAELLEDLGKVGLHETEMRAILLEQGFALDFPREVETEAEELGKKFRTIPEDALTGRRDFRSTPTFTIDPENAKDFDDALSVKFLPDGTAEVGVHIADVTHYVSERSAIEKEARKRATSVYLVDRTIPMLPEVLSNDLCSLREKVDRLTFSAVFTLTAQGAILDEWYGETVIHSDKRFTYEEAQKTIDAGAGLFHAELSFLNHAAKQLKREREKGGSISFEQDEVRFKLDEHGAPLSVFVKPKYDTNALVEDFMLLANRKVTEYFSRKAKHPHDFFVYRVHDVPNPDRLEELSIFLKAIGFELSRSGNVTAAEINRLFAHIQGKPHEKLVQTATIRSMAKAVYSTKNIGHFGLGFEFYTHFTSPIRRYPDMMVHRLLKRHLKGHKPLSAEEMTRYERLALTASAREVEAAEAERESVKYKQVEYLQGKIGKHFEGTVSGIADWGLYVEEKVTKAEGLVRFRDMADYYVVKKGEYRAVGERSGRAYSLGDKVTVELLRADPEERMLDWKIIDAQ